MQIRVSILNVLEINACMHDLNYTNFTYKRRLHYSLWMKAIGKNLEIEKKTYIVVSATVCTDRYSI